MAYPSKARGEDANAEYRSVAPKVDSAQAAAAPQVSGISGGAPKVNTTYATPGGQWYTPAATKPKPWQTNSVDAPDSLTVVPSPKWTLKDVQAAEPKFVEAFKNTLWDRYQKANEGERQTVFWQGVKQNPELAAASFVRQALTHMHRANQWINGEQPPTLERALQDTLKNNETRRWLDWTKNGGRRPR